MLGMHPIFTLFGTTPDLSTAAGAANYVRQLTQEADLHVLLVQPGKKLPWDTRTVKERESDQVVWDQLRRDNPQRGLPAEMSGFHLASDDPNRVGKLIRSAYKIIDAEVAERDYLYTRRDMATWAEEGARGQAQSSLPAERLKELQDAYTKANADLKNLANADGKPPRKGTNKHAQYVQAEKIAAAEPLNGDEKARLQTIESNYHDGHEHPNFAVEVGRSNVVVADCDTDEEVAWFKEWAAQMSGDDNWLHTAPTVMSPGVHDDGQWKHKNGGHYWFSINTAKNTPTPAGLTVQPIPEDINKVFVTKPGTDIQFVLMVNSAYVLIPPSHRKEGDYTANGPSHDLPGWLYDHIISEHQNQREAKEAREAARAARGGLSPEQQEAVEQWWQTVSWGDILGSYGWTRYFKDDNCGCPIFSRPGGSSGKSATAHVLSCSKDIYSDSNDPPIHFWTDQPGAEIRAMLNEVGSDTLSKLQLVAAIKYNGDIRAALREEVQVQFSSATYDITQVAPGVAMVTTTLTGNDGDDDEEYGEWAYPSGQGTDTAIPQPEQLPAQTAAPTAPMNVPEAPAGFVLPDDDETYEASAEEEEELPAPTLAEEKAPLKVYKDSGITDDKIEIRDLDYLLRNRPPVKFLIRNWIQENTVSLIVGPSNAGKSAVVLDMLCTMAAESSEHDSPYTVWINQKAKRRNVLYIAGEGIDGVVSRVAAWEEQHGLSVRGHMVFKEEAFKFMSPESSWYRLGETIIQKNIDVVVFDTLAMMMTGMEENSNDDMGRVVSWLQNLQANTGATILLLHHTTKSTENVTPRGASALTGAVASQVLVQQRDPETLDDETRDRFAEKHITPIRVSVTKQKDGRYADDLDLTLVPVPVPPRLDQDGNPLPNVDDFGDEDVATTVLVGDSTGRVVSTGSVPNVEFAKPSTARDVPADFTSRVLEAMIDRVVTLTTGSSRSRRVSESTKSRLRTYLEMDMDYYQYGATKDDLIRSFESALDIAFREGLVEYEGSSIIPTHSLSAPRSDRDAVRKELMDRISDHISVEEYVADHNAVDDAAADEQPEPQPGPQPGPQPVRVPTSLPNGAPVGQSSPAQMRAVRPDVMPGEKPRSVIPTNPVVIDTSGASAHAPAAAPTAAPTAAPAAAGSFGLLPSDPGPAPAPVVSGPPALPNGVTALAPSPGTVVSGGGGFTASIPNVDTPSPVNPPKPAVVRQPPAPPAVPSDVPGTVHRPVQQAHTPNVQSSMQQTVTTPPTPPVPPNIPGSVQVQVPEPVQQPDPQFSQTYSSSSNDPWGDYEPGQPDQPWV